MSIYALIADFSYVRMTETFNASPSFSFSTSDDILRYDPIHIKEKILNRQNVSSCGRTNMITLELRWLFTDTNEIIIRDTGGPNLPNPAWWRLFRCP